MVFILTTIKEENECCNFQFNIFQVTTLHTIDHIHFLKLTISCPIISDVIPCDSCVNDVQL